MPDIIIAPWLLQLSLLVIGISCVVLIAVIASARAIRRRRDRTLARELEPLRRDVLEVASGEDEGGSHERLAGLPPRLFRLVAPVLIGMLSKVRGAPSVAIVAVLAAHGAVRLAHTGLGSRSRFRRARSAWTLGLMRDESSVDELIPLLQDRDRSVAITAARALGMLGDPSAATPLLDSLEPGRRGHGGVPVWIVVDALAEIGPGVSSAVGTALRSPSPTVRAAAAQTAARAQLISLGPQIRTLLADEDDVAVLAAAATALGGHGGPADIPALNRLATADRPRSVRLAAVEALGEIGGPDSVGALLPLLTDDDAPVAEHAGQWLTRLGPQARAEVEAVASREGGTAARYALVTSALGRGAP
ncbi:MAG: HEAT repeat domain-containing protein [Actinomycetia bacterium]|nr:HEAT repeat domain-containing protein [Actinomycetes bacterium]